MLAFWRHEDGIDTQFLQLGLGRLGFLAGAEGADLDAGFEI